MEEPKNPVMQKTLGTQRVHSAIPFVSYSRKVKTSLLWQKVDERLPGSRGDWLEWGMSELSGVMGRPGHHLAEGDVVTGEQICLNSFKICAFHCMQSCLNEI